MTYACEIHKNFLINWNTNCSDQSHDLCKNIKNVVYVQIADK